MKRLLFTLSFLALVGCSHNLGNLVTDVRTDGKGCLVVQRANLVLDGYTGQVSIRNQTIDVMRLEGVEVRKP